MLKNIDFMAGRKVAAILSGFFLSASIISLTFNQLDWGLDFTGGTLVEVSFEKTVSPERVRDVLNNDGFSGHVVQYFGSEKEILIRIPPQLESSDERRAKLGDQVILGLRTVFGESVALRRSEFVGPAVGNELTNQGGIGLLTALGIVLLYVAFRFQLKFALAAVAALFHDVIITLGFFSLFQWDFDLTVLAALLAVIGYSLNDSIVVSDRIRENFRAIRKTKPISIINTSLNQTLGRTVVTSFTTLLVLFTLLILGGELISGFAIGLIIGVIVGTYSSIYVATNILLLLKLSQEDMLVPVKEGSDQIDQFDN